RLQVSHSPSSHARVVARGRQRCLPIGTGGSLHAEGARGEVCLPRRLSSSIHRHAGCTSIVVAVIRPNRCAPGPSDPLPVRVARQQGRFWLQSPARLASRDVIRETNSLIFEQGRFTFRGEPSMKSYRGSRSRSCLLARPRVEGLEDRFVL